MGADVSVVDEDKKTPLHYAVESNSFEVCVNIWSVCESEGRVTVSAYEGTRE